MTRSGLVAIRGPRSRGDCSLTPFSKDNMRENLPVIDEKNGNFTSKNERYNNFAERSRANKQASFSDMALTYVKRDQRQNNRSFNLNKKKSKKSDFSSFSFNEPGLSKNHVLYSVFQRDKQIEDDAPISKNPAKMRLAKILKWKLKKSEISIQKIRNWNSQNHEKNELRNYSLEKEKEELQEMNNSILKLNKKKKMKFMKKNIFFYLDNEELYSNLRSFVDDKKQQDYRQWRNEITEFRKQKKIKVDFWSRKPKKNVVGLNINCEEN